MLRRAKLGGVRESGLRGDFACLDPDRVSQLSQRAELLPRRLLCCNAPESAASSSFSSLNGDRQSGPEVMAFACQSRSPFAASTSSLAASATFRVLQLTVPRDACETL